MIWKLLTITPAKLNKPFLMRLQWLELDQNKQSKESTRMNPFNAGWRSFPDFVPSTISCQVFNQPRLLQNGMNTLGDGTWISLSPEFFDTKDFPSKDKHIQPGIHSFFIIWWTKPYRLEFVKNSKVADFCFLPLKLFNNYFLTI